MPVGAVDAGVRGAIQALGTLAQRQAAQLASGTRIARDQFVRETGQLAQARFQPPVAQNAGHVRPDLNTGTHLRKSIGLLDELHIRASARERQRGSQAGNAATGDQDVGCVNVHARIVPAHCGHQNPDNTGP